MSAPMRICPQCRASFQPASAGETSNHCPECGFVISSADGSHEAGWLYARNRQRVGPVPWAELCQLAAAGELLPTDMVLQSNASKWTAVADVPGLIPSWEPVNVQTLAVGDGAQSAEPANGPSVKLSVPDSRSTASQASESLPSPPQHPTQNVQSDPPVPEALPLSASLESWRLAETVQEKPSAQASAQSSQLSFDQPTTDDQGPATKKVSLADCLAVPGYALLEVLGRGGMGVVYKALQVSLNRKVALKMILSGAHAAPEELARFRAEGEAVARLQHPNIVQIHEVGEHKGQPYFSLEYVDGGSLAQQLRGVPQPERHAAQLVETMARAMHHAHQHGIVHRDLKPANVLLTRDGVPKVTDFGLAKTLDDDSAQTRTGAIMGTPSYMAPEQASGMTKKAGPLVDVYALGAILYEMLTGRPPFRAATVLDTLEQVRHQEPVPPRRLQPKVPIDLETICLKCLEKEPRKRYPTAEAQAEDLRRFLDGEPIQARPVGKAERVFKWAKRRPAVAALLGVVPLMLLALVASGVSLVYGGWLKEQRDIAEQTSIEAEIQRAIAEQERQEAHKQREMALEERAKAVEAGNEAQKQRKIADRYLYCLRMNLAQRAWNENRVGHMDELLQSVIPPETSKEDLRGFEWYYLRRLRYANQRTLMGHTNHVTGLAFSPDGKRLASASWDKTVKIWDAAGDKVLLSLEGHTHQVLGVTFSPDGKWVATASHDKTVRIWDTDTGKQLLRLDGHHVRVNCVAFSPNGQQLASGDGPLGATRVPGSVRLWDLATGKQVHSHTEPNSAILSLVFSLDGSCLAFATNARAGIGKDPFIPGEVKILPLPWNERPPHRLVETANIKGEIAFSPDGKWLAGAAGDRSVKVWEAASGKLARRLEGHHDFVLCLRFNRDGSRLVSGARDGLIKVWNFAEGTEMVNLRGHTDWVTGVTFSPDGQRVASCSHDRAVKLWRPFAAVDNLLEKEKGSVFALAFSPDSQCLAVGRCDGSVRIWGLESGNVLHTLPVQPACVHNLACSPDGRYLASGSLNGRVRIWDIAAGRAKLDFAAHNNILSLAYSPDGRFLATASGDQHSLKQDGELKIWDVETGKECWAVSGKSAAQSLTFSPDGQRLASAGFDTYLRIWDATSGKQLRAFQQELPNLMTSVAFSPDGTRIASGSAGRSLILWDVRTGAPVQAFSGHMAPITKVAFSPDGKRLASIGDDGTLKVWDVGSGQELLTFAGHGKGNLAFSPDGHRLATAGGSDGSVRIWDARPVQMPAPLRPTTTRP